MGENQAAGDIGHVNRDKKLDSFRTEQNSKKKDKHTENQ
jgi:hypothetical protein